MYLCGVFTNIGSSNCGIKHDSLKILLYFLENSSSNPQ